MGESKRDKPRRERPEPSDDGAELLPAREIVWPKEVETLDNDDLRKRPLWEWLRHYFPDGPARDVMFDNLLAVVAQEVRVHGVHSLEDLRRKASYATQAEVWLRALRRVGYRV